MKKLTSYYFYFVAALYAFISLAPQKVLGAGLVSCDPQTIKEGQYSVCTFCDLLKTVRNAVNFLFQLALILAVVYILYGAWNLLISQGDPARTKKGWGSIRQALIGVAILFSSWLIVDIIMKFLGGGKLGPWNTISC